MKVFKKTAILSPRANNKRTIGKVYLKNVRSNNNSKRKTGANQTYTLFYFQVGKHKFQNAVYDFNGYSKDKIIYHTV